MKILNLGDEILICPTYSKLGEICKPAAGAFFSAKKGVPGIWEHVNSGNCQNFVVLSVFYTSSQQLQI